jgi:hypothetical protein
MKTFVVLAVTIVLGGILFCTMVMAAPSMPDDLQMVQPDSSLPKELLAFFGKWEGATGNQQFFLIVEKIDEKKASLYIWRSGGPRRGSPGWRRAKAKVIEDGGKYKLQFIGTEGTAEFTLRGEHLDWSVAPSFSVGLTRVP